MLPPSTGFTYELCAGLVDKQKSVAEIAIEELMEECGYAVTEDCLEEITQCRSVECNGVIGCRSLKALGFLGVGCSSALEFRAACGML